MEQVNQVLKYLPPPHPKKSEDFPCMYLQYKEQEPFSVRAMKGSSLIYVPHFQ